MHSNWSQFKLLCRILGGQDDKALPAAVVQGGLDRQVELAQRLDLLPALATRMDERPDVEPRLSPAHSQLLQQALKDNTRDNMQALMQALKIARVLNSRGIEPIFLKGTALLLTHYSQRLGFRRQVDIDLVVEPEAMEPACLALLDDGYVFYSERTSANGRRETYRDLEAACRTSSAHHHLPPLVKPGCSFSVELHRHYLPARFQDANPLLELVNRSLKEQQHNARFRVPAPDHQLTHLLLGTMVHDGNLARRDFPIREACDYIELWQALDQVEGGNHLADRCNTELAVFSQLVEQLMGYSSGASCAREPDIRRHLQLMEARYNSPFIAKLLDAQARAVHLGRSMLHNPAKLPGYLRRLSKNQG